MQQNLLTIKQASDWASGYLSKDITVSNISYLVNYGKIKKYGNNGTTLIDVNDLKSYLSDKFDESTIREISDLITREEVAVVVEILKYESLASKTRILFT